MRGIWKGVRPNNCFHWTQDVQFGVDFMNYPFHPAREAKDGVAASEGCLFYLNGQRCKIGDLKAGDKIEISGKPASEVRATRVNG